MKIVSWNILASEWIKKSYYPKVGGGVLFDRTSRYKKVSNNLISMQPDIILLQEVMKLEYKKLVKVFLKDFYISDLNPIIWQKAYSESGNVTFLRKSLFNKNDIKHFPLEFGIFTSCIYNNKPFNIFNIHLDDISSSIRQKQIDSVSQFTNNIPLCIIGGDFNQNYRSNSKLYNLPGFNVNNFCPTYYIESKMNIDNILSKGLVKDTNNTCPIYPHTMESGFKMFGSDHLPVQVSLK